MPLELLMLHPFLVTVPDFDDHERTLRDLIAKDPVLEELFRGRELVPIALRSPPSLVAGHQFEFSSVVLVCYAGSVQVDLRWTAERNRATSFHTKLHLDSARPEALVLREKIWFELRLGSEASRVFAFKGEMSGFRADTKIQFPSFYNLDQSIVVHSLERRSGDAVP